MADIDDELIRLRRQLQIAEASNVGLRLSLRKVKALSTKRLMQRKEVTRLLRLAKNRIEVLEASLARMKGE